MADVQVGLHFCEDYRIEVGNKPMIFGIYAPVVFADEEYEEEDHFYLIVFFTAAAHVEHFKIEIDLTITQPGAETVIRRNRQEFKRTGLPGDPWGFAMPLPVEVNMRFGTQLRAVARVGDDTFEQVLHMRCGVQEAELKDVEKQLSAPSDAAS